MKKYTLLVVVALLLLMLGVIAVALFKFANQTNPEPLLTENFTENLNETNVNQNKSWMRELASVAKKDYSLAANEIYIEYARPIKEQSKTAYQLNINKNDIYSMFCVTQTLRNANVDFMVVKDGVQSLIFLNTTDSEILSKIITELRNFNIQSNVTEVRL